MSCHRYALLLMPYILLLADFSVVAQPPGGSRDRGGFRGRSEGEADRGSRRGGFPGRGESGGRGGSRGRRGGFNPADMMRRFDRNGNNMIDPDEAQGPAQFFLRRMAQNNPKIDLSKPVPIDLLSSEIQRMRGGRSDDDNNDRSSEDSDTQLLVPDFSLDYEPPMVMGFGADSGLFNVRVQERDLEEAEERMRRYDRDRDGNLTPDELRRGRWSDDPMQYDRNRDGKLTKSELAVRYARRRLEKEDESNEQEDRDRGRGSRGGWAGRGDWGRGGGDDGQERNEEPENRFGEAKSYRMKTAAEKVNETRGLPDFFERSDANGDGQVMMSEYSSSWDQQTLVEFQKYDLNRDGVITAKECLTALEDGARVGSSRIGATGSNRSKPSKASASSRGSSSSSVEKTKLEWAKTQIAKYDLNNDAQLTANEWEKMLIKPDGADTNGDGVITAEEYADFRS